MNKFKKIMLGALSVLTLGLFVATGAKVNAADAIEAKTYNLYAKDFFTSTTNGSKIAPSNETVTPVTLQNSAEYYVDTYGTNRANKNAAVSNPSSFDTSNWDYEYYSGGTRSITITAGDTQSISCSIFGYGTSTSKSVTFGNENAQTCAAKNTLYEFSNSSTYLGTMTISVTDKITIAEIRVTITNATTFTVSFNANGGNGTYQNQQVVSGNTATQPANNPTRDGYRFLGWFTSSDNGVTLSDTAYNFSSPVSLSFTLYAKWEEATTYTVTFKKYSTDTTPYATVSNVVEGDSVGTTNWPSEPKVLNKTFDGWFDGNTEYTSSTTINANTTLVAKYSDLTNDLVEFGDYYAALPTSNADPHIASFDITADSKVQAQEINKRKTGTVTFDDNTQLSGCIQCQKVVFTLDEAALVSIYAIQTGSGKNRTSKLFKGENEVASFVFGYDTKTTITYYLEAGTYTVSIFENSDGSGTLADYYGIRVNKNYLAADTTVTVDADKSTDGDTIRFMGTLAGITDVDNIDSIQLLLSKDGVKAKKDIYFTTVYRSVKGKYAAADNTYYVIFALKDVKDVTGTFNFDVKVLFTDGSYTVNEVQGTYVAE